MIQSVASRAKSLDKFLSDQRSSGKHCARLLSTGAPGNPALIDSEKDITVHSEKAAHLHGAAKRGTVVELSTQNEFGIVLEEGWSVSYIGPFEDMESAKEAINSILDEWSFVGAQAFIVQDMALFRKDFEIESNDDGSST